MYSTFDNFLDSVGKFPLLTAAEEIELARQVQAWLPLRGRAKLTKAQARTARIGRRAYDKFFCANLRLVVFVAKRYMVKAKTMTIDDLIQEGCMGLARSIEKFDPERGYKFSTYSYWWIRQAMSRAIEAYDRLIRLPIAGIHTLAKLRTYSQAFYRDHGRFPTKTECMEHCDVSVHLFDAYLAHAEGCHSLNVKISDENPASELLDVVIDDERSLSYQAEQELLAEDLHEWIKTLSLEEQDLLNRRYGLDSGMPMSLHNLGNSMHLSREAVRHKEVAILRKLRAKAISNQ